MYCHGFHAAGFFWLFPRLPGWPFAGKVSPMWITDIHTLGRFAVTKYSARVACIRDQFGPLVFCHVPPSEFGIGPLFSGSCANAQIRVKSSGTEAIRAGTVAERDPP